MRTGRSYVATAVALGIITLSGCAAETADEDSKLKSGEDWGDENKYPELGGAYHSLTAFNGTCTFVSGTMTVTAATGAQSIIVGKRAVDSAILVNGALISGCTTATSATLKQLKVAVASGDSADQVVIFDFLGGVFASGIAAAPGIVVDLGGGTADEVRVRGTSAVDTWVFGSDGMAINADAFKDLTFTNVEKLNFSLGAGNDILTGTVVTGGLGAGKGVSASALLPFTAFGGDGNDVITGGSHSDTIFGGPGADTLSGGGNGTNPGGAANSEADRLAGQEGADVITQDANNNGKDIVSCGVEALVDADHPNLNDTVTYALRGTPEVRDVTSTTTLAATDSERIKVILVNCTQTVAGTCDVDAAGFTTFAANSGQVTEAFGSLGTLVAAENDAIDSDCEVIVGGMDNDVLTGSDVTVAPQVVITGNNTLSGGPGDDLITGGTGDDVLSGDDGADTFNETAVVSGADVMNGGAGTDTVDYSARLTATPSAPVSVTMDGAAADDGYAGELDNVKADVENLLGSEDDDELTGNALDNVITGGLGDDVYTGLAGNDTFVEGAVTSGADEFNGGLGTDTVDYSKRAHAVWVTMADEVANDGEVTFTAHATTPVINTPKWDVSTNPLVAALTPASTTLSAGTSGELDKVMEDIENVNGGLVADVIVGNELNNVIDGGPGADFIFGEDGDDTLFGGNSGANYNEVTGLVDINYDTDILDTAVTTLDGNDHIWGGNGADTLDGSVGTGNKLVCGAGDDLSINQGSSGYRDGLTCES